MLKKHSVLPGLGPALGITIFYLSLIVLIPLSALFLKSATLGWEQFWNTVTAPRVLAAYKISFGTALIAALINAVLGLLVAWVLVRYDFVGKRVIDALVGLPFVVRTVQPVLADLDREVEEAAASLGATRWQTITRVIMPTVMPALLTGFALVFVCVVGEYGAVIFIAGNMPMVSEIAPLLIITKLEQFEYAEATAIAVVMLIASFLLLLAINLLQWWSRRRLA